VSYQETFATKHAAESALHFYLRRMKTFHFFILGFSLFFSNAFAGGAKPHIIFVMADDMGWGQTGYQGHPVLKTPNLDAMAANGLRFDRFYAGGPVCSPTRASVMTGRSHDRTGVLRHGYALRTQEKTIAQALKAAGYVTGHFGKWHLNGYKGPGVPVLRDDAYGPGAFGFDEWTSATNYFDQNPLMSRNGEFVELEGDSSDVVVSEALAFLEKHRFGDKSMFVVIWYGSPHSPFKSLEADKSAFGDLDSASADHYGELVAMDRSIGLLRQKLRDFGIAENTFLVFCSDNGGLPKIEPDTVGGLRGFKGSVFEGGLRVPGIIEWPSVISPRVTNHPACVTDLFPTVADVVGLPREAMIEPVDGISLKPLFAGETGQREKPLGFRYGSKAALIDNRYKILTEDMEKGEFQVYDLAVDPNETKDISVEQPELAAKLKEALLKFDQSVTASFEGKDYPERSVSPPDPEPVSWYVAEPYKPYVDAWRSRWEYESYIERQVKELNSNKAGKAND